MPRSVLQLIEYSVSDMKIYLVNITGYTLVNSEIHHIRFDFGYRENEGKLEFVNEKIKRDN